MRYLLTTFCILSLSACALHQETKKQALCDQAKRQEVLNNSSPSINPYALSANKNSTLDKTIEANC